MFKSEAICLFAVICVGYITAADVDCTEDYKPTPEEIAQLQDKILPDNNKIKCMFACAFKNSGLMDGKGMLSVDGTKKAIEMSFSDDAERKNKALKFLEACKSVNDQAVSDGDKGCERAALIFKCNIEQGSPFSFH